MLVSFREGDEFGFYGWTVTWSDALYLPVIEGRVVKSRPKHLMDTWVSVAYPAGELTSRPGGVEKTEFMEVVLAILDFHFIEVYGATVETNGCASFHSRRSDAMAGDTFSETCHSGFGNSSARE